MSTIRRHFLVVVLQNSDFTVHDGLDFSVLLDPYTIMHSHFRTRKIKGIIYNLGVVPTILLIPEARFDDAHSRLVRVGTLSRLLGLCIRESLALDV